MANLMENPVSGWEAYKTARIRFAGEEHQDEFYAEADVADAAILLPASTLEGVAAKLRRAFISVKGDAWSERLSLGDETARENLEMSDPYTRMLFGAIEDLERLAADAKPSVILTLHARYEQAWNIHHRLDCADPGDDLANKLHINRGTEAILRETDALREAILYQLPTTDEEMAVLAYHAWATFDTDPDAKTEREGQAHDAAMQAMFNYLVSTGRADMERLGAGFATGAMRAFNGCSARAGKVEG